MTIRQKKNHFSDQLNYVKAVSIATLFLYIFPTSDIIIDF